MEKYSAKTIDDFWRLVIHGELREKLSLVGGDIVSLRVIDTIIILQRADENLPQDIPTCKICALGRVELPIDLRSKLNLKIGDKISAYNTDNIIILKKTA